VTLTFDFFEDETALQFFSMRYFCAVFKLLE